MPVFFTPFMITRLALIADLSAPISAPVAPVETETAPISAPESVETAPEPVETAAPVEASMKMTKAELQELATARNIKFAKSWTKAKLIEAINA